MTIIDGVLPSAWSLLPNGQFELLTENIDNDINKKVIQ